MKYLKDALIGLAVTIVLFAAAESVLWAAGLGEPDLATPLSRGFDATVPYLVADPEVEGGFVTTFSDGKFPEKHIAPKSERFRVVLFGGSNTASFRAKWLQADLDERAGVDVYEVVNLGREGYGSERVAIILDQALDLLEPDLVWIYSGHNEFIERGFQMDLEDVWETEWGRDVGEVARRSRIVNAMASWLAPEAEASDAKPERQRAEYKKFSGLTWEETQVFFEGYRQNLTRMCKRALEDDVEVVLSTIIYNRFAMPFVDTLPGTLSTDQVQEFRASRTEIEAVLPKFLGPLLPRVGWKHVFVGDWDPKPRAEGTPNLPGRRECFGVLAELDSELTPPKPKARRVYKALARVYAQDFTVEERIALQSSLELLERALKIVPDHPTTLFEAALVGLALDPTGPQIVERFEDAGRFDRAPRRGSRSTNAIVASVAAELEVELFDADALFASRMPMGLVGFEWMIDECHLATGARKQLMRDVADALTKRSR